MPRNLLQQQARACIRRRRFEPLKLHQHGINQRDIARPAIIIYCRNRRPHNQYFPGARPDGFVQPYTVELVERDGGTRAFASHGPQGE